MSKKTKPRPPRRVNASDVATADGLRDDERRIEGKRRMQEIDDAQERESELQGLIQKGAVLEIPIPEDTKTLWDSTVSDLMIARQCIISSGYKLLHLKLRCGHGNFQKALAERNITARTANDAMQIAKFYLAHPEHAKQVRALSGHRILKLARLPEGSLREVLNGADQGSPADLTERLQAAEKALKSEREARCQEQETNEKLMSAKNKKNDELARKLEGRRTGDWPDEVRDFGGEFNDRWVTACQQIKWMRELGEQLVHADFGDGGEEARKTVAEIYGKGLDAIYRELVDTRAQAYACFGKWFADQGWFLPIDDVPGGEP